MYQVVILPKALKDLSKLDKSIIKRIMDKLTWLSDNIEIINTVPLKSKLSEFYKLKIGDYRVIYDIDYSGKVVTVHKAGHRKEIYKDKD